MREESLNIDKLLYVYNFSSFKYLMYIVLSYSSVQYLFLYQSTVWYWFTKGCGSSITAWMWGHLFKHWHVDLCNHSVSECEPAEHLHMSLLLNGSLCFSAVFTVNQTSSVTSPLSHVNILRSLFIFSRMDWSCVTSSLCLRREKTFDLMTLMSFTAAVWMHVAVNNKYFLLQVEKFFNLYSNFLFAAPVSSRRRFSRPLAVSQGTIVNAARLYAD